MTPNGVTKEFWKGKHVLVTGHTGFKGVWLSLWLERLGANVSGISLPPTTSPNLFTLTGFIESKQSIMCDIRNFESLLTHCKSIDPEIIFHLAAQPLVKESYLDPIETFSSNIMGTANILESMRSLARLESAVMVTTDKVYQDTGSQKTYTEIDPLGGHDPYSSSKAACEIVIDSYRKSFFRELAIPVASARAGNVVGGGDWSKDRLIPDAIRAWQSNKELDIRRPHATRPWQHVLEPLHGYLILAQEISKSPKKAQAYNFGQDKNLTASVKEVVDIAREYYGDGAVLYNQDNDGPYEADWLSLDIEKSKRELGFLPKWNLQQTIEHTISWYKDFLSGKDALLLCHQQIDLYENSI